MSITKNVLLNWYVFFNEKKMRKIPMIFRKLTLKVKFLHFSTPPHYLNKRKNRYWLLSGTFLYKLNDRLKIIFTKKFPVQNHKICMHLSTQSSFDIQSRETIKRQFIQVQFKFCVQLDEIHSEVTYCKVASSRLVLVSSTFKDFQTVYEGEI